MGSGGSCWPERLGPSAFGGMVESWVSWFGDGACRLGQFDFDYGIPRSRWASLSSGAGGELVLGTEEGIWAGNHLVLTPRCIWGISAIYGL